MSIKTPYQLKYVLSNRLDVVIFAHQSDIEDKKRKPSKKDLTEADIEELITLTKDNPTFQAYPSPRFQRFLGTKPDNTLKESPEFRRCKEIMLKLLELPSTDFMSLRPEDNFQCQVNRIVWGLDSLYNYIEQLKHVDELGELISEYGKNVSQSIAEQTYQTIHDHYEKDCRENHIKQSFDDYFIEKLELLYDTFFSQSLSSRVSVNNLYAAIIALMIAKQYFPNRNHDKQSRYLQLASMHENILGNECYEAQEKAKPQAGAIEVQKAYSPAKTEVIRLLAQRTHKQWKRSELVESIRPEMVKFVEKNGHKPMAVNLTRTLTRWSKKDPIISIAFDELTAKTQ